MVSRTDWRARHRLCGQHPGRGRCGAADPGGRGRCGLVRWQQACIDRVGAWAALRQPRPVQRLQRPARQGVAPLRCGTGRLCDGRGRRHAGAGIAGACPGPWCPAAGRSAGLRHLGRRLPITAGPESGERCVAGHAGGAGPNRSATWADPAPERPCHVHRWGTGASWRPSGPCLAPPWRKTGGGKPPPPIHAIGRLLGAAGGVASVFTRARAAAGG